VVELGGGGYRLLREVSACKSEVLEPRYGYFRRNRSSNDPHGWSDICRAVTAKKSAKMCSERSEFLLCLFSCFHRRCGCAEHPRSVTTQKIILDMRRSWNAMISPEKRLMENAEGREVKGRHEFCVLKISEDKGLFWRLRRSVCQNLDYKRKQALDLSKVSATLKTWYNKVLRDLRNLLLWRRYVTSRSSP